MKSAIWVIAALAIAVAPLVAQPEDLSSPKLRIAWAEFKKLYDAKQVLVIDVRDPESFSLGHVPGATSIPLSQVEQQASKLKNEKRAIVTYCA